MPTTIGTLPGFQTTVPAHRVFLKTFWPNAFVEKPYLYCDSCAKRAAPEKSSAILHYDYGWIVRPGTDEPVYYPPLSIDQQYVRIEIDAVDANGNPDPIYWYGVILETAHDAYGTPLGSQTGQQNPGTARQPTGTQKFTAHGLEELLYREVLRNSQIQIDAAGSEDTVGRPLVFNAAPGRSHDGLFPNRSTLPGALGSSIFSYSIAEGTCLSWATFDIVDYLLTYQTPLNYVGQLLVPFEIDPDPQNLSQIPDWDQPRLDPKGHSIGQLLEKLLSRKRLVGYFFDVDPGAQQQVLSGTLSSVVKLYAFSFAPSAIVVPTQTYDAAENLVVGTATIQPNPDQVILDFDLATDVEYAQLRYTIHDQYDQVRVRGARKTSTFTLSFEDTTLQPDWDTTALQSEYKTAASTQGNYPTTNALRQWRNANWRANDKYQRVYRWFAIPFSWGGVAGNGEGGVGGPVFLDDTLTVEMPFHRQQLLLTPYLGLWTDHDYTQGSTSTGMLVANNVPANARAERLRSLAFLKVTTNDGTTRYQPVEKLAEVAKTDKHSLGGASFHCSLRTQDKAAGIILSVHGAPQHAIAKTDFSPVDGSDITPVLDYRDNLIATVSAEHDFHAEATWPNPLDIYSNPSENNLLDYVRTLLIDLSHLEHQNALRLDYVVPQTVVGIKDGVLQRSPGGYARDDRGRLAAIAQMAYQWYALKRQAFEIKIKAIANAFFIGQFVVQIGSGASAQAVNTPITSITWDLLNGTTTITTGYAELDFAAF